MKQVVQFVENYGPWPGMADAHAAGLSGLGIKVLDKVEVPSDAVTFGPLVVKALNEKPDGIVFVCKPASAAKLIKELKSRGWKNMDHLLLFSSADAPDLYTTGGKDLNGAEIYNYINPNLDNPRWNAFKQAYADAHNGRAAPEPLHQLLRRGVHDQGRHREDRRHRQPEQAQGGAQDDRRLPPEREGVPRHHVRLGHEGRRADEQADVTSSRSRTARRSWSRKSSRTRTDRSGAARRAPSTAPFLMRAPVGALLHVCARCPASEGTPLRDSAARTALATASAMTMAAMAPTLFTSAASSAVPRREDHVPVSEGVDGVDGAGVPVVRHHGDARCVAFVRCAVRGHNADGRVGREAFLVTLRGTGDHAHGARHAGSIRRQCSRQDLSRVRDPTRRRCSSPRRWRRRRGLRPSRLPSPGRPSSFP